MKRFLAWLYQQLEAVLVAFRRFPLAILCCVAATALVFYAFDKDDFPVLHLRLTLVFALGAFMFVGIPLCVERSISQARRRLEWLLHILGGVILIWYFFHLEGEIAEQFLYVEHIFLQHILLTLIAIVLIRIAPYLKKGELKAFWHFNFILTARVLLSVALTLFLFAGFGLALFSTERLLEVAIDDDTYGRLFTILAGIFAPLFFLAGVPDNYPALQKAKLSLASVRFFARFILFPLVLTYFAILYLYLAKILITNAWPEGWVAIPILIFSGLGLMLFFFLYPLSRPGFSSALKAEAKDAMASYYPFCFFLFLIPLVGMLYAATWFRVQAYGITEPRYFLFAIGDWLLFISLYFLLSRQKSIKVIPISLGIVALLSSFGPWGAFEMSQRSQVVRLQQYLTENNILIEGKIYKKADDSLPVEVRDQISSIIYYLSENHGFSAIQPWFEKDLQALTPFSYEQANAVLSEMGLSWVESNVEETAHFFDFVSDEKVVYSVSDYDYVVPYVSFNLDFVPSPQYPMYYQLADSAGRIGISYDKSMRRFALQVNQDPPLYFDIEGFVRGLIQSKRGQFFSGSSTVLLSHDSAGKQAMLVFRGIHGAIKDTGEFENLNFEAMLFVKRTN